jgi:hypothetical protein
MHSTAANAVLASSASAAAIIPAEITGTQKSTRIDILCSMAWRAIPKACRLPARSRAESKRLERDPIEREPTVPEWRKLACRSRGCRAAMSYNSGNPMPSDASIRARQPRCKPDERPAQGRAVSGGLAAAILHAPA